MFCAAKLWRGRPLPVLSKVEGLRRRVVIARPQAVAISSFKSEINYLCGLCVLSGKLSVLLWLDRLLLGEHLA
jgi:hypothetical protein